MAKIDKIPNETLEVICNIIAETKYGLAKSEITTLLSECNIRDIEPSITKRIRLYSALKLKQVEDDCANNLILFLQKTMNPVRYINNKSLFEERLNELNQVLGFIGLKIDRAGVVHKEQIRTKTIDDAHDRAKNLCTKLLSRNIHGDVLKYCKAEIIQENYFHAVLEVAKSLMEKIREKTNLELDGSELVDKAFSVKIPVLAVNSLRTESEKSEQIGFAQMLKGFYSSFRNTTAHAPKILWNINENDTIDILIFASFLHRKLDCATQIPKYEV